MKLITDRYEASRSLFATAELLVTHQTSWQYSDGDLLTGASNAGEVGTTNRDCQPIYGYRWMMLELCDQLTAVRPVVYHSYGAHLFTAQKATHQ